MRMDRPLGPMQDIHAGRLACRMEGHIGEDHTASCSVYGVVILLAGEGWEQSVPVHHYLAA